MTRRSVGDPPSQSCSDPTFQCEICHVHRRVNPWVTPIPDPYICRYCRPRTRTRKGGTSTTKTATCHPDRALYARGLCTTCYIDSPAGHNTGKNWAKNHPERHRYLLRRAALQSKYGITPEDYEAMLVHQNGLCALCGTAPTKIALAVDHDHVTGRVRGLLCSPCNRCLGRVADNEERLKGLIAYLGYK
jgi:Recombination endonuclease VII